jgi:hypothetical protein
MTKKGHPLNAKRSQSPVLPELEDVVLATAAARVSRSASRKGIADRRGARLAVIGFVCLAFGGTAMAAGLWDPQIGTNAYSGPTSTSDTPVPEELTDVLGVLRRPQTAEDRSAAVEATLRRVSSPTDGVRPESVRYLGPGVEGEAAVLYSAERGRTLSGPHEGPYELAPPGEPLCIAQPFKRKGFKAGGLHRVPAAEALLTEPFPICFGLSELLAGHAFAMIGDPVDEPMLAVGMVPDGVATVTVKLGSASGPTIPIVDNYFESFINGSEIPSDARSTGTIWRDAKGNVVPQRPEPAS